MVCSFTDEVEAGAREHPCSLSIAPITGLREYVFYEKRCATRANDEMLKEEGR